MLDQLVRSRLQQVWGETAIEPSSLELSGQASPLKVGLIHTQLSRYTPWKINMEPTNHPFRKENDLPNLHDYVPC